LISPISPLSYKGNEPIFLQLKNVIKREEILKIEHYLKKIYDICSKETCFPKVANQWNENNKFWGHCAIISLLLQDKYGGEIYKAENMIENITHYYNIINGKKIDATSSQYKQPIIFINDQKVNREKILENENTKTRYEKVKTQL